MYGPEGQPEVRNPILILRAWLRFFDDAEVPIAALEKGWAMRYAEITEHVCRDPDNIWDAISSAMTASVLHLLQLHIVLASATRWLRRQVEHDPTTNIVIMGMRCPVDREAHRLWTEGRLSQEMWSKVADHEANSGLWCK